MTKIENRLRAINLEIGANIRIARKIMGVSQTALGEAVGVTFQQIQKYERGTNRVSAPTLVLIAEALGTTPHALMGPNTKRKAA